MTNGINVSTARVGRANVVTLCQITTSTINQPQRWTEKEGFWRSQESLLLRVIQ